jgi:hypothetical protein
MNSASLAGRYDSPIPPRFLALVDSLKISAQGTLSVCHNCGTLSYSFSFSNQTDQRDETVGFREGGIEMET